MSVLPEYFDPFLFHKPGQEYHFTIKRPYTTFSKSMNIDFKEYNVSFKLKRKYLIKIINKGKLKSSMYGF